MICLYVFFEWKPSSLVPASPHSSFVYLNPSGHTAFISSSYLKPVDTSTDHAANYLTSFMTNSREKILHRREKLQRSSEITGRWCTTNVCVALIWRQKEATAHRQCCLTAAWWWDEEQSVERQKWVVFSYSLGWWHLIFLYCLYLITYQLL